VPLKAPLHVVDAENLVREVAAPGLAGGFGKVTSFRGMTAVQEKPKHVRGVSKARHHHLRLDGIQLTRKYKYVMLCYYKSIVPYKCKCVVLLSYKSIVSYECKYIMPRYS
jgi:hypothetical protein